MPVIHDRSDVARILDDPAWLVPEPGPGDSAFARLRVEASRFANGRTHDERRALIDARLAAIDPERLARAAAASARAARAAGVDRAEVARRAPVETLAAALGHTDPASLPDAAAIVAGPYATGVVDDAAAVGAAAERLLGAAAPGRHRVLDAQLLVQAHAATGGLIAAALRRADAVPAVPTGHVVAAVLRDEPPVPATRRLAPAGHGSAEHLVELRLGGPDREATAGAPPRTLAFGAGPRRCPARDHAVAVAAAVVDVLREQEC
ncbi:hypothetical protein [Agromyces sp. S2-1-8]|uniref:hypothetical protein n=1 Tax=Agromyces sp. S2-1-8 TaxID=2897180 RepID=UPI001E4488C3|nr:hypothetical protein [Agromyces sp. S2-1-8]MCD5347390.1 hypothetical protein [Agromyces sp. S2-1-8]